MGSCNCCLNTSSAVTTSCFGLPRSHKAKMWTYILQLTCCLYMCKCKKSHMFVCFLMHLLRCKHAACWGLGQLCPEAAHPTEVCRTCGSTLPPCAAAAWGFVGCKGNAICSWSCLDAVSQVGQVWLEAPGLLFLVLPLPSSWDDVRNQAPLPSRYFRQAFTFPASAGRLPGGGEAGAGGLNLPPPS